MPARLVIIRGAFAVLKAARDRLDLFTILPNPRRLPATGVERAPAGQIPPAAPALPSPMLPAPPVAASPDVTPEEAAQAAQAPTAHINKTAGGWSWLVVGPDGAYLNRYDNKLCKTEAEATKAAEDSLAVHHEKGSHLRRHPSDECGPMPAHTHRVFVRQHTRTVRGSYGRGTRTINVPAHWITINRSQP